MIQCPTGAKYLFVNTVEVWRSRIFVC